MKSKAVFIDKDGTLVENIPYNVDPTQIVLASGVGSLKLLQSLGYKLLMVSNQSGIAHGYFNRMDLEVSLEYLRTVLTDLEVRLDGIYICPHHPKGVVPAYSKTCSCRKPQPGLLLQAAIDHQIDLKESWMVGDILNDVEAGARAGCRTILLDVGSEKEWKYGLGRKPDYMAHSLGEAVELIEEEGGIYGYAGR